ncbi:MAG: integration host factor subunit beta [Pseudomonadales bacterium]|nr:integration host factor subunit beta [Pseudomonadales bacterium]
MALTKSELIELVAEKQTQLSAKDVELAVKTMIEEMSQTLATGGRIEIRGFGSFSLHFREPRTGRNPKTGEAVDLQGKYVPHFKPGKELRDRVNSSMEEEIKISGVVAEAGEGRPNMRQPAMPSSSERSPEHDRPAGSMSRPPSSAG